MVAEATPYAQVGNEQAERPEQIVHILMRVLAGSCDGARTLDGTGFNRLHAKFGHDIAELPFEELTARQLWQSRRILETYKNTQLKAWWPLVPDVPEPVDHYNRARDRQYHVLTQPDAQTEWRPPVQDVRRATLVTTGAAKWIELVQNYSPRLIDAIKQIPGRRYNEATRVWRVPIEPHTIEPVTELICEYGYEIPEEVQAQISESVAEFIDRLALSHAKEATEFNVALPDGLQLYDFQKAGVQFGLEAYNVMYADQMGLGKTPEALVTAAAADAFPVVVICPASLKHNWKREAQKWMPGKSVAVLDGKIVTSLRWHDSNAPIFDVVILNYDILAKWADHIVELLQGEIIEDDRGHQLDSNKGIGAIIVDECHAVKNPQAQRTRHLKSIIKACSNSRRMFLSGTPVVNRPMEFWTLIDLLGYARYMGGRSNYEDRYGGAWRAALEELNTKVRMKFFIRRLKKDVLKELPDKQRVIVPVDIDNRKAYEEAEDDIAKYFADKKTAAVSLDEYKVEVMVRAMMEGKEGEAAVEWVNEQVEKYRRSIYSQFYGVAARSEQLLRWEALKQLVVRGKMKSIFSWIDEFMESGEKLVIFATHTDVISQIARRYNAPMIRGDVNVMTRDNAVQRFQNDPDCRLIVGNIKAMGEGLTLTAASDVAFVEFGWSPKDHDQAEDRCHRIGQKDNVTVWSLCAEDTIDEEIAVLIDKKREMADALQDGAGHDLQEAMMTELKEALERRIAERKDKRR